MLTTLFYPDGTQFNIYYVVPVYRFATQALQLQPPDPKVRESFIVVDRGGREE